MTQWFDRRARQAAGLTPDQQRKVNQITAAFARSDTALGDVYISDNTFKAYARNHPVSQLGVLGSQLQEIARFHTELLGAVNRIDALHTGLRAERLLRDALTEYAAAVDAWHDGLASTDPDQADSAIGRMNRHFANAEKLGKAGSAALKLGQ